MRIGTSSFGPFDVATIREVVQHIDAYDDGESIYVKDEQILEPSTPAAVTNRHISGAEMERELGFRFLGDVDEAREVIQDFGPCGGDPEFRELLARVEEWCM